MATEPRGKRVDRGCAEAFTVPYYYRRPAAFRPYRLVAVWVANSKILVVLDQDGLLDSC